MLLISGEAFSLIEAFKAIPIDLSLLFYSCLRIFRFSRASLKALKLAEGDFVVEERLSVWPFGPELVDMLSGCFIRSKLFLKRGLRSTELEFSVSSTFERSIVATCFKNPF